MGLALDGFDSDGLETKGPPSLAVEGVSVNYRRALFSVSDTGTLVYVPASERIAQPLEWVDRDGNPTPLTTAIGRLGGWSRLSPDETRLAVEGISDEGPDIWIYDIERGTRTRLTTGGTGIDPVWSPKGDAIAYSRPGPSIYLARADGGGTPEPLVTVDEARLRVTSWSPDGKLLTIDALHTGDVWVAPVDGGEPEPFVDTPFDEWGARFSPDGGYIAYVSDESGRDEIYVQPYPGPGERWTVSTEGGREPVWPKNGRELFYRNRNQLVAVDIELEPTFLVGAPHVLFEGPFRTSASGTYYDVTHDGKRFVMIGTVIPGPQQPLVVVLHWLEELERLVATDN